MLTNELRKGDTIFTADGYYAVMMDNKKGNIRTVEMDAFGRKDMGSMYVWNIVAKVDNPTIVMPRHKDFIELTEKQIKARDNVKAAGF